MKYFIKNFIGGSLLIIATGVAINYNLGFLENLLIILPGWFILFVFNE